MKKRGQVYILAAVIIGVALFTIFAIVNTSEQIDLSANFNRLNENYEREAERFINTYVSSNNPVELEDTFPEFTLGFNNFARETNPEFGIITTLSYTNKAGGKVNLVVNMLDTPVFVTTKFFKNGEIFIPSNKEEDVDVIIGCSEISEGGVDSFIGEVNTGEIAGSGGVDKCAYEISKAGADKVFLFVNDMWVGYKIPTDDLKPGLIVTAKSDEGEQTQIFVNENQLSVDNSDEKKLRCSKICDLNAVKEDDCRPGTNKKEQKCCKLEDNTPKNDKCNNPSKPCCRVNCKIFKNQESCELQKRDEGTECCFVNNKCVNSIYNEGKFICGLTQEEENE